MDVQQPTIQELETRLHYAYQRLARLKLGGGYDPFEVRRAQRAYNALEKQLAKAKETQP